MEAPTTSTVNALCGVRKGAGRLSGPGRKLRWSGEGRCARPSVTGRVQDRNARAQASRTSIDVSKHTRSTTGGTANVYTLCGSMLRAKHVSVQHSTASTSGITHTGTPGGSGGAVEVVMTSVAIAAGAQDASAESRRRSVSAADVGVALHHAAAVIGISIGPVKGHGTEAGRIQRWAGRNGLGTPGG